MQILSDLSYSLAYVVLGLIVVIVAKIGLNLATSYSLDDELTSKDNRAVALSTAGFLAGVIAVFIGAAKSPFEPETRSELVASLGTVLGYSVLGVVFLLIGRVVLDKLVLRQFAVKKELLEDRNVGTGAVEAGVQLGTGLVVAGAVHGESGGVATAVYFFLAGQACFMLFAWLYQLLTPFDVHAEIERDNVAAGYAFGGTLIALGVILMRATAMPYVGWRTSLESFLGVSALGFIVLIVGRFVTDHALLPKSSLSYEVASDQNIGAAWIEASTAVGLACMISLVM